AAGSALAYSTYLGGSGQDIGRYIAVDGSGNAYVTGTTLSTDFPTVNPIPGAHGKGPLGSSFVAKVPDIGSLTYTVLHDNLPHSLTLRRNGANLELLDNGSVVVSRLYDNTTSVDIESATLFPVSLTINNLFGRIERGITFNGAGFSQLVLDTTLL